MVTRTLQGIAFAFFCFLGIEHTLSAQERAVTTAGAIIVAARGLDFSITSGGKETNYRPEQLNNQAVNLPANAIVQTGENSFIDIGLTVGKTTLRLAENTSIAFKNISGHGGVLTAQLIYGRLLVHTMKTGVPVHIQTGDSITEVQEGDINIDYMVVPKVQGAGKPVLSASAISGNAVVLPRFANPVYGRITIQNEETVMVDGLMSNVERFQMNRTVRDYWAQYFMTPASYKMGSLTSKNAGDVVFVPYVPERTGLKIKTAGIITGLVLMLGGAALQGTMYMTGDSFVSSDMSNLLIKAGFAPLGIGTFVLIAAAIYKPRDGAILPPESAPITNW
ncbi:MAG: hypothetical protein LBD22_07190 [Spirochaetaceae bacterium]|jgi:hypothetical protein|nr:hypothetical protein [Spirochaetaceae bacterium]